MGLTSIIKFFSGRVGYMPLGTPCVCIVVINDHSNATMPFVISAFLALSTVLANHYHYVTKCQDLVQHPSANCMCVMSLQVIVLCQ